MFFFKFVVFNKCEAKKSCFEQIIVKIKLLLACNIITTKYKILYYSKISNCSQI